MLAKSLRTLSITLLISIVLIPVSGFAMPFYKICVFSDVKGRVVMDGKPVAGATVTRSYRVQSVDVKGTDSVLTDANGQFSFPALWRFSLTAWMSANPTVFQEIYIDDGNKRHLAYSLFKPDYRLDGELLREDFKPWDPDPWGVKIRLSCDLNSAASIKIFAGLVKLNGLCEIVSDERLLNPARHAST